MIIKNPSLNGEGFLIEFDESDESDRSDRSDESDRSDFYLTTFLAPFSSRMMRRPEAGMSLMRKVVVGAV